MKHRLPRPRLGILLLLAVVLTACGGVAGGSWAGINTDLDGDTILVAHNQSVIALNATSGDVVWTYPGEDDRGAQFYAMPVADNGSVYVGDYDGRLHAINAETGAAQWIYEPERETLVGPLSTEAPDRVISGVAISPELAYFGLGSRNVVAVSREDASEAWEFQTEHGVWGTPLYLDAEASPSGEPTLLVTSLDHHLYALNPENGEELWNVNLGGAAPGNMLADPERERVYVGTFGAGVVAVDVSSAGIVARFDTEDWVWGNPALDGDRLYFGDLGGNLYAVQITEDGLTEAWKRNLTTEAIRGTPLLVDDLVIVGAENGTIYAANASDGTGVWQTSVEAKILTELVSVENDGATRVVAGTDSGERLIVALNVENGQGAWTYGSD